MAPTFEQLKAIDDAALAHHDEAAPHTNVGTQWYIDELRHRQIANQTRALVWLTVIIGVLTAANVAIVVLALAGE